MLRKTSTIVSLAATLMIGGAALAQGQPSGGSSGGSSGAGMGQGSGQSDRPSDRTGSGEMQRQHGGDAAGLSGQQGGQQVDQQINQQLQQFSQDQQNGVDKLFVLRCALDNQFEMRLAEEAQQKVQNPQVKQLVQRIVQDHQQGQQQLQQTAQQLGVQVPQGLTQMKEQEIRILTNLPGDQFEKHYVAHLQAMHAKDVAKFQSVSQLSQNDQVKQFAQQMLPKLQQHAQQVTQVASAVGVPSINIQLGGGAGEARPAGGRIGGSGSDTGGGAGGTRGDR